MMQSQKYSYIAIFLTSNIFQHYFIPIAAVAGCFYV